MAILSPRCAAIAGHKATAVVTIGWVDAGGTRRQATRTCGTMTADIERLVAWLAEHEVTPVAMEATGVYWQPLVTLLEPHVEVILATAAHVKAVPGRKTDVQDSEWRLDLLQHGLVKASFIPPAPMRALREVTRSRASLTQERTRAFTRIQQVVEDANRKLASVASAVLGASGRALLAAIGGGETNPERLALLARGPCASSTPPSSRP
jgi:transposase